MLNYFKGRNIKVKVGQKEGRFVYYYKMKMNVGKEVIKELFRLVVFKEWFIG